MPSPSSQRAGDRPIAFVLNGGVSGAGQVLISLTIRPEELTRSDPSRMVVQQTLGGDAWADSFGPGLATITINGHTGWRPVQGQSDDGTDRFMALKKAVFDDWHERRKGCVAAGTDPNTVTLQFADALNRFTCTVVPMSFVLRRSKSRPLLLNYQIVMTVIGTAAGGGTSTAPASLTSSTAAGLASLDSSVAALQAQAPTVGGLVGHDLQAATGPFMQSTTSLFSQTTAAIAGGLASAGALIAVSQLAARAGANVFRTIGAAASIVGSLTPNQDLANLMSMANSYSNAFCVLSNSVQGVKLIADYSALLGSSNCSSTSGGSAASPLAGSNPFFSYAANTTPPVTLSPGAQASLTALANTDPITAPMSAATLAAQMSSVTAGMQFA